MTERGKPQIHQLTPADNTDSPLASRGTVDNDNLLAQLFQRYNRALMIFIRNTVRNQQAAEEIAQDTYLRMLERATPEQLEYPRAYLFRTARNLAIDHLRRGTLNVIDSRTVVDEASVESPASGPQEQLSYEQTQARLNAALAELPVTTRQVLYYRRYKNWPIATISAEMGISDRMVYKHMEAALKHLAHRFDLKQGAEPQ